MLQLLKEPRAREMIKQASLAWQNGQLQRLAIDGELVPAELDQIAALGEQFRLVTNLLQRVFTQRLEARAQLICAHAVAQTT